MLGVKGVARISSKISRLENCGLNFSMRPFTLRGYFRRKGHGVGSNMLPAGL